MGIAAKIIDFSKAFGLNIFLKFLTGFRDLLCLIIISEPDILITKN